MSNSFYVKPVTITDIIRQKQLNTVKSSGVDGISIKHLLIRAQIIAPTLTRLFNNCIQAGIYPQAFKIGQIVPIFKSGAKDQCINYRPISLLCPLFKIF